MKNFSKGQFGFDLNFLKRHLEVVLLSTPDDKKQLIIAPSIQGRILTSTSNGMEARSYGWINHELIASKKTAPHINAFGGEDRFWIGPEAGQFGLFFKHGDAFTFENSQVPAVIDTEPFELIHHNSDSAVFRKEAALRNYSDTAFSIRIDRTIRLLSDQQDRKSVV